VDARLVQAVTRLKASDARRFEADERIQILETQVAVFGEDFANEQRDRLKARKRLAEVEHQLEAVMRKVSKQCSTALATDDNNFVFKLPLEYRSRGLKTKTTYGLAKQNVEEQAGR